MDLKFSPPLINGTIVGDHVVLLAEDLKFVSSPEEVTVRTAGEDSRSMPSIPAKISQQLIMEMNNYRMKVVGYR